MCSGSADVQPDSLAHSAGICHSQAGWLHGRQQLLTCPSFSGGGSAEPGTPPLSLLQECRSVICLHWGNDIPGVILAVLSRGKFNYQASDAGNPGSFWVEISLLCKAPAPDFCRVWNCTFPFLSPPLFSPLCRHDTVWLQLISLIAFMHIYSLLLRSFCAIQLTHGHLKKKVQVVQDLNTQSN